MIELFENLASTTKRLEKKNILTEFASTNELELAKKIINYAYAPEKAYDIIEYSKSNVHTEQATLDDMFLLLDDLYMRVTTGGAAKTRVEQMYQSLSKDNAAIFERILAHDMRCGCGTKTFNETLGFCVYIPPYRRCKSFSAKNISKIKMPALSQVKMDGAYNDIVINKNFANNYGFGNNHVTIMSRNGLPVNYYYNDDVNNALIKYADNYVIMGEALVLDPETNQYLKREDGNGYLNSDNIDMSLVKIVVWDIVPYEEYLSDNGSSESDIERFNRLATVIGKINNELLDKSPFSIVDTRIVNCVDEIISHFRECVELGLEGTVVKNYTGKWKSGDSPDCVKIKILFECELRCTGIKEGTGKNKGRVGSLEFTSEDNKLVVDVGIGYSDEEREQIMLMFDAYEGKIATIRANDIMQKDDVASLFLPRKIEFRNDKSTADTLDRIIEQKEAVYDIIRMLLKQ